ncbi:MAG: hypothetical protein WBD36_09825 [Bacteroidota bacterium]
MTDSVQQRIGLLEKKVGAQSKSPLFAQLAHFYLEAGRPKDALRVCDQGLANYPFFTTGHLIKGKTLLALNMRAEARREFEWVQEYLPSNETVAKLLAEVPPGSGETIAEPEPEPVIQEAPAVEPFTPEVMESAPEPVVQEAPIVESAPQVDEPIPEPEPAPMISPDLAEPPPAPVLGEPMASLSETPLEEPPAEQPPAAPSGFDFGAPPTPEPAVTPSPFEETAPTSAFGESEVVSSDDAFGLGTPSPVGTPSPEPATPEPSPFASFDFPSAESSAQPVAESPATPEPPSAEPGTTFDFPIAPAEASAPSAAAEGRESFEQYAMNMRGSLEGENSMTLDEYLASGAAPEFDVIAEITQKLQTAKKTTPVINLSERKTSTATEADSPSGTGFVTPTLAEIYAKQGWYDDAIKAYRSLISTKPGEKDRFEKRIAELEELKKTQA